MGKEKEPYQWKKETLSLLAVTGELKTPISFLLVVVVCHMSIFMWHTDEPFH